MNVTRLSLKASLKTLSGNQKQFWGAPFHGRPSAQALVRGSKISSQQQTLEIFRQNAPLLIMASLILVFILTEPTFGVTVESLKAPIKDLKDSLFGGWLWIAKIGAAVGGCVMAVYQRDIVPLATGAAIGLGIHFYDGYFGDTAAGALI